MHSTGRTLVIETASEACSIALFDGRELRAHDHRELGRGHAERLIPMIEALPDKGRAERILVSLGPGSFTGVRIGIAAARALGIAWQCEVLGYPTLALIAAQAHAQSDTAKAEVTVCMNGGHGEWFVQSFVNGLASEPAKSMTPEAVFAGGAAGVIAGNRAEDMAKLFSDSRTALDILPNAAAADQMRKEHLTANLSPIYGREPDAKPQAQGLANQ